MTFAPLGDSAVVVTLGSSIDEATLLRVRSLTSSLERATSAGIVDVVPAYATVTVFYDVLPFAGGEVPPYEKVCALIAQHVANSEHSWPDLVRLKAGDSVAREPSPIVEIPVCYGGEYGPDLEFVARHCGMTKADVCATHSGANYVVHAVGFTPGFPYLGGLPDKLRTPRRPTPRTRVPAGTVGIGWAQTGIYPVDSPGGWQLIGRTPLALFRSNAHPPALLRVGDHVKFKPITAEEFTAWK